MSLLWIATILISALLAWGRLAGLKGQAFQAAAHLWAGALHWAWWVDGHGIAMWLAIGLDVVEVFAARKLIKDGILTLVRGVESLSS